MIYKHKKSNKLYNRLFDNVNLLTFEHHEPYDVIFLKKINDSNPLNIYVRDSIRFEKEFELIDQEAFWRNISEAIKSIPKELKEKDINKTLEPIYPHDNELQSIKQGNFSDCLCPTDNYVCGNVVCPRGLKVTVS